MRDFDASIVVTSFGLARFVTAVGNGGEKEAIDSQPLSTAKGSPDK